MGSAALRIARQMRAKRRKMTWQKICICGEHHRLLFTTATGQPIEPRNLKRSFDARCKKARVRQIKILDTSRTCDSLPRRLRSRGILAVLALACGPPDGP